MNNRDTMGDVYEYVLGKMAASGTNGQFRTPRHIIAMMVELMKPTIKDTICDPAMGSAGFIVESAKYVKAHYADELMKRENQEHYRNLPTIPIATATPSVWPTHLLPEASTRRLSPSR